jgi:uncharacterized protein
MNPELEYRFADGLEVRAAEGFLAVLRGLAAPYNAPSLPLVDYGRRFTEIIRPGAFKKSLQAAGEIFSYYGHDSRKLLARRTDRTLSLSEEARGLTVEIRLKDTGAGREALAGVRAKTAKGLSIGFLPLVEQWISHAGQVTRELLDLDLRDISVVEEPAYQQTTVSERSYERFLSFRSAHPGVCSARLEGGRFIPGAGAPLAPAKSASLSPDEFRDFWERRLDSLDEQMDTLQRLAQKRSL